MSCPWDLGDALHDLTTARILGPFTLPSGNAVTLTWYPMGTGASGHTHDTWAHPPSEDDGSALREVMRAELPALLEASVRWDEQT